MKPGQNKLPAIVVGIAGCLVAVWLGATVAPGVGGGLGGMLSALTSALHDPLRFHIVTDTPRCVLVCLFLYGLAVLLFVSSGMNFRRGEEYGSAKWGSPRAIDRKYRDRKNPNSNLIMTQHIAIGSSQESMYRHRRNLNTVVIGGSGSGKSTTHVLINILQASHSYVVLDPSGEMLRATGNYLKEHGYITGLVKVIGGILCIYGILQVGMSFSGHDPSQRIQGLMCIAGAIIIFFSPEILAAIQK